LKVRVGVVNLFNKNSACGGSNVHIAVSIEHIWSEIKNSPQGNCDVSSIIIYERSCFRSCLGLCCMFNKIEISLLAYIIIHLISKYTSLALLINSVSIYSYDLLIYGSLDIYYYTVVLLRHQR